jgi:hypothetical protein
MSGNANKGRGGSNTAGVYSPQLPSFLMLILLDCDGCI